MFPSENKTKQTLIIKGKIDKFGYIEARNSLSDTIKGVEKQQNATRYFKCTYGQVLPTRKQKNNRQMNRKNVQWT